MKKQLQSIGLSAYTTVLPHPPDSRTMRPPPNFWIAVIALAMLAGCGTKTPLTLPPPAPQQTSLLPPGTMPSALAEARPESRP